MCLRSEAMALALQQRRASSGRVPWQRMYRVWGFKFTPTFSFVMYPAACQPNGQPTRLWRYDDNGVDARTPPPPPPSPRPPAATTTTTLLLLLLLLLLLRLMI